MNHKNTIEINNKVYDAKSGVLLYAKKTPLQTTPVIQPTIDGVVSPRKTSAQSTTQPIKKEPPAVNRTTANHHKKREPQKSQTLMRHGVKRPSQGNTQPAARVKSFARQRTNTNIPKSPYVRKFGHQAVNPITKTTHVPYQHPPQHAPNHTPSTKPANHTPPEIMKKSHQTHSRSSAQDLFEKAITAAPNHEVTSKVKKSNVKSLGKLATLAGSFVLLAGFILYMNLTAINLQVASSQAGFAAQSPDYTVAGFSPVRRIDYRPGQITLTYNSNSDNRSYRLTQEVSSWNSTSLQENYLANQNKAYRTTQEGGRTIFLYDKGKATWVNGGIWYNVDSETLSSEQLINIASSL